VFHSWKAQLPVIGLRLTSAKRLHSNFLFKLSTCEVAPHKTNFNFARRNHAIKVEVVIIGELRAATTAKTLAKSNYYLELEKSSLETEVDSLYCLLVLLGGWQVRGSPSESEQSRPVSQSLSRRQNSPCFSP
jgi:hypothetical protein